MKTFLNIFLAALLFSKLDIEAQGYVVPNGVVINFSNFFFPGEIDVLHNPNDPTSASSYTGFTFVPKGKTPLTTLYTNTFMFDPVADIGVRVFFVNSNSPISLAPILSASFIELLFPNQYVFTNNIPFYLGLYTGNVQFAPPDGIYSDPLFGWVKLVNNRGTIELLDSALEYGGAGIYAGTQTIIATPEPGVIGLCSLGALIASFRCWRKKT